MLCGETKSFSWKADKQKEELKWSFKPTTAEDRTRYPHMWKKSPCATLEMPEHEKSLDTRSGSAALRDSRDKGLESSSRVTCFNSRVIREVNSQTQFPELPGNGSIFKLQAFQVQGAHCQKQSSTPSREPVPVPDTAQCYTQYRYYFKLMSPFAVPRLWRSLLH